MFPFPGLNSSECVLSVQSQNQLEATGKHIGSVSNSLSKWMKSGLQNKFG